MCGTHTVGAEKVKGVGGQTFEKLCSYLCRLGGMGCEMEPLLKTGWWGRSTRPANFTYGVGLRIT